MGLVIVALVIVGVVAFAGGGHTVKGFGKDMQQTGNNIQQDVDTNK